MNVITAPRILAAPPTTHLRRLENESIHIIREVVAESKRPGMLYSIGKDSSVLLHLIRKAFYPALPPFPLLHVDTGWKFREMITFRDETARRLKLNLIVHTNTEARDRGVDPIHHGASYYTHQMKTVALKAALAQYGFDAVFGGARRDEEKSRAKERVVSIRNAAQEWEPHNQRAEFWNLYNCRVAAGESLRVFPLSNWTELDIWQYIEAENIPVVPLYFAASRPTIERDGSLIMVDDDRLPLRPGEQVQDRMIRFRSLGCYPLTGATLSGARTLGDIVRETRGAAQSERSTRLIDHDGGDSMERKKREGYF